MVLKESTLEYGIPVGVLKAGSIRVPRSWAIASSSPRYQGKKKGLLLSFAIEWPDNRPPNTRMVVSNTWGLVFTSKETQSIMFRTACSNPGLSFSTTKESRTSISVREKLPATSFVATLALESNISILQG